MGGFEFYDQWIMKLIDEMNPRAAVICNIIALYLMSYFNCQCEGAGNTQAIKCRNNDKTL